jgi:two-component system, OmpR family, sensor kinase
MIAGLATQARKLDRLLADLLDVDRLRHGFVLPSFHETDIGELVTHVASGYAAPTHRIQVEAAPIRAEVDAPKVERIVDNLLANAVNHTPPGTSISVGVAASDGGVLITVDDDGPGVPADEREAIFGIFTRGSGESYVPGTGVGLSLVAQFAELHGGRVWVEESSSGGASFRVFLPSTPRR